jgi:hypothetical protein
MGSFDWKSILATVAPTIATALGGPLAGAAVSALGSKILGKPNATQEEVQAAVLAASPADLLKYKEAEMDFKKAMSDAGIQLDQIAAADRANARDREVKTQDWTPRILAGLVVTGWLAAQYFLLHNVVDPSMRELVNRLLGTLDAALMLVLSYYFGSSASSKAQSETIATIAKEP